MNSSKNRVPSKSPAKINATTVSPSPRPATGKGSKMPQEPKIAVVPPQTPTPVPQIKKTGSTLKVGKDGLQITSGIEKISSQGPMSSGAEKKRGRPSKKEASESVPADQSGKPGRPKAKHSARSILDGSSFQTYIFRVMKEVKPELSISKKGMHLVNNILAELFIKIMQEARNLMIFSKRQTLSSKEVESAIKLHFPGELMKLAIQTSRGSLQKFTTAE